MVKNDFDDYEEEDERLPQEGLDEDLEMELGEKDEDPEHLLEDEEIDEKEEAFLRGYNEERGLSKCAQCGDTLDEDQTIEKEINNEVLWFCSDECVEEYEKELEEKES